MRLNQVLCCFLLLTALTALAAEAPRVRPLGADGKPLNLDLENGTLKDWTAVGPAFAKQPTKGDMVYKRRQDMRSQHEGDYWIGGFEAAGDAPTGTLTSVSFKITQTWASFLVGGGPNPETRVELLVKEEGEEKRIYHASGDESENMERAVVSLGAYLGKQMFIRLVDLHIGHWGHINFDDFVFHESEPVFPRPASKPARKEDLPPRDDVKFAGLTAEEAATEAALPPGFAMKVFAAEPDIQQPIAFCMDDRGRLWLAEGHNYPKKAPEGQGKDRIIVFEDTDGDHRFNKRTVFMEKLNLVSGLEVGFGGVWIGAAPHLMFVPVSNWDDPKPAGEPKVLLDGWDYIRDTHETLNTFMWGPDGWLYGCHGVFCPSNVGKPGAPASERQWVDAALWRYHPTKHVFEVFAEGTSNPWGADYDEHGQFFMEACVVPHMWHMIQGARYERQGGEHYCINLEEIKRNERHRDNKGKPVYPYYYSDIKTHGDHVHWLGPRPHAGNARSDSAGGGHAHAGLLVYQGDSWPQEYRGAILMNNIHGQRINMDLPVRKGSGFSVKHGADFVNFNDRWSQVLNLLSDQDGSVFMIDWYDKNQCHHNNVAGHDRSNGRIYKVVYKDQKWTPVDLQKKSDDELVKLQLHPNEFHARHARRILQERGGNEESRAALTKIVKEDSSTKHKLRAVWTLHATGGVSPELAAGLLNAKDDYVRAWAIQLLCEDKSPSEDALKAFARMAHEDNSPVVRLYLASALQRLPLAQRPEILAGLIAHAEDANDHNLPLMYWFAAEPVVASDSTRAVMLLAKSKIPLVREYITRRMAAAARTTAEKK